jgi:hypothetical protein
MSTWRISGIVLFLFTASILLNREIGVVASQQPATGVTVIQGATVITGTGRVAIRNAAIVIENGRIRDIGPRNEVRVPNNAQAIDARGKWIVPGLIDAHVHFSQSAGLYTRPDIIDLRERRPYQQEIAWIKQRLPNTFERYLSSGITGAVDCGGPMWNFRPPDFRGNQDEPILKMRVRSVPGKTVCVSLSVAQSFSRT